MDNRRFNLSDKPDDAPPYVPQHANQLLALGLLTQVQKACQSIVDLDPHRIDGNRRVSMVETMANLIKRTVEVELVLPEANGELPMLLKLREMVMLMADMVDEVAKRTEALPFLDALHDAVEVSRLHAQPVNATLAELAGIDYIICTHLGEAEDTLPLVWDSKDKIFKASVVLLESGTVPVLNHQVGRGLVLRLAEQFPDLIMMDHRPEAYGRNPLEEAYGTGHDDDGKPFLN